MKLCCWSCARMPRSWMSSFSLWSLERVRPALRARAAVPDRPRSAPGSGSRRRCSRRRMRMSVTVPIGTPELHRRALLEAVHRSLEEDDERAGVAEEAPGADDDDGGGRRDDRADARRRRSTPGSRAYPSVVWPSPSSAPAGEEAADLRVGGVLEQLLRRAAGDRRARLDVEEDAVVADREDARAARA